MKVKVIKEYVDKNTGEYCKVDSVREYEEERAEKLIKKGFVEAVDKKAEKKEEKTEAKPNDNQTETKAKPKKK